MPLQLEVAVEAVEDAVTAALAGADRIEVSAALDLGGLTPSPGLFDCVQQAVKKPVWVMLRPRGGDFVYSDPEFRIMLSDLEWIVSMNPAGLVVGILQSDGTVHVERMRELMKLAPSLPIVFHRAFDRCPDPAAALETLVKLGVKRVLTSGREPTAVEGAKALAKLVQLARGQIEILPCGRIRAGNAIDVIRATGCDQVHGSFSEFWPESNDLGRRGYPRRTRVSFYDVQLTRKRLDEYVP
ncbi:MAG: copper homeostasis protein CutC [Gemmataceae bacterium]